MTTGADKAHLFKELTHAALEAWADKNIVARGKQYFHAGWVSNLALTSSGAVVARVRGERRYTAWVDFVAGGLNSRCTCPYELTCKHAVAVALAYQDRLKRGEEVPALEEDDPRHKVLRGAGRAVDEDEGDNLTPGPSPCILVMHSNSSGQGCA